MGVPVDLIGLAAIFLLCLGLQVVSCFGTIIVNPSDTNTVEGSIVVLQCVFAIPSGTAETCYWLKDGAIINIENYTGIYAWIGDFRKGNCSMRIIGVANSRDDGRWWCQIPPSPSYSGDISRTATLTVYVKPTPPTIYYEQVAIPLGGKVSVTQNDTAEIQCVSRYGNPAPKLSWSLNGSRMDADKNEIATEDDRPKTYKRTTYLIRKFGLDKNGKILQCTLDHETWNVSSNYDVMLDILYSTTTVNVALPSYVEVDKGQNHLFPCTADGNPPARCEWMMKKDESDKQKQQQHWIVKTEDCDYNIVSVSTDDEGQYMCLAGNGQLIPSQEITLKLRRTKDISGIIAGVIGGLFLVAIIVIIVVVYFLRRKVIRDTKELPTRENLDRASTRKLVVDRGMDSGETSNVYMVPLPNEDAPLNPMDDVELRYAKRPVSSDTLQRQSSHIYADPHIYENIPSNSSNSNKKSESEQQDDEGYVNI